MEGDTEEVTVGGSVCSKVMGGGGDYKNNGTNNTRLF